MDAPLLTADFRDFLRLFNANRVDYLIAVPLIALADLKRNKKAAGRHKDLADLEDLP